MSPLWCLIAFGAFVMLSLLIVVPICVRSSQISQALGESRSFEIMERDEDGEEK